MAGGAGFLNYQSAFKQVTGKEKIIPISELNNSENIELKMGITSSENQSTTSSETIDDIAATRTTKDIMMKADKYSFIQCDCGLKLKIPADFDSGTAYCPSCGKEFHIHN
jgi:heat shock protein HtpX